MSLYLRAEAVLLAIDPAKGKSGAAILRPEGSKTRLVTSGIVTRQAERETFVSSACELAQALALPLVVVAEEWDPPRGSRASRSSKKLFGEELVDKNWNYPTILGIGEGWGRWTAEFERYGIAELDIVRATPNTWRDALYGKNRVRGTEELKAFAVRYVEQRAQQTLPHDAAEAVCLGFWGLHAPEVHRRVDIWLRKNKRPA